MSINGVDYTKQLARDREYFQDAARKTKEAADKRVELTNERAEHVMNKQRENFVEDKTELESHYQKNLDGLKDKIKNSTAGDSKRHQKEIEKERELFSQESAKKRKDFTQRLHDIKSSYSEALESEKDRNQDLTGSLKSKFKNNVSEMRNETDSKIRTYQEESTAKNSEVKDKYDRERQDLVRKQEDRLTDLTKDSAQKRMELKNHISSELDKTKKIHGSEKEQQQKYSQERLTDLQGKFQKRYEALATDFDQRNDHLVRKQQQVSNDTNREHNEKVADLRQEHNSNLRNIELEKRRRDTGSGEYSEVTNRQQGQKDQVIYEDKIKNLKDDLVGAQRNYQRLAMKDHNEYKATLHHEASEASANLERKLSEANANKIVTVATEREKSENKIQNREHQNRLDKAAYEAQLMNERNSANERMKKLKENFHTSMKALETKHQASIEDVTKVTNQDKKLFVQKVQENRSNEIFEMKREFNKIMDATVQDYEKRLANYQRDNEYIKLSMSEKIHNIMAQTDKQLESQRTLFEDRRAADVKGQQLLMDQRENQLKKNFSEMNLNYQKKIDKMQIENDSKLKLITNDYETKLKELKAVTSKELAAKETNHQIELERIKQAFEGEKTRVVNAYESQIDAIKQGHRDQMDQMASYKRLS